MKASCILLAFLIPCVASTQDIILKATFQGGDSDNSGFRISSLRESIDINNDGVPEMLMRDDNFEDPSALGYYYLDPITFQTYDNALLNAIVYPQAITGGYVTYVSQVRSLGVAEVVMYLGLYWRVEDLATNTLLLEPPGSTYWGFLVYDYDSDGLDDYIVRTGETTYNVYGIANGNPVSPPQDLNIQTSGNDYVITWNSVPSATAYRILWSSSIDGVSYTRIGYTTDTSFVHRNRASEPMGFYRVMSEDNGTGVVRMVGLTGNKAR